MTIDCTLDNLKIPALPTYMNEFGTKKSSGGLTTAECTDDAMLPFRKMRPYEINEDAETTEIQHNAVFIAKAADITLTLHDCSDSFLGCEARVINVSSGNITVKGGVSGIDGGTAGVTVPAKREIRLIFLSDGWHSSYNDYCNVTEKEIATSAVTTEKLGANAVTTAKIKDLNVTTSKIATSAVTTEKLASGLTLSGTTSGSFKGTLTGNATNVTGVVAVANGGTGASTATQAINNLATGLEKADGIPTDAMGFITTDANDINVNASDLKIYRRSGLKVWAWVQNKISSVLGLTKASYGGNAATASYADSAGSAPASDVYSWAKASTKPSYSKSEVGLGNVDNTADSAKSVRYAASAGNADTVDGHHFNWAGQGGQPSWVWGGNDSGSQYVYNPSNFRVNYAESAGSAGSVAWSNVSGKPSCITGSYSNGVLNLTIN